MKHFLPGIFITFTLLIFSGCDIINPEEPQASYIRIDTILVETDPVLQGTNSSKISDAWIYVDQNLLGAFELPCEVPVLLEGKKEVLIGAGIKINGLSGLRSPYAFYRLWEGEADLVAGETTLLSPTVTYFDSLNYPINANFDDISGNIIEATIASDTTVLLNNNPTVSFEGNGCFQVLLRRDSGYVEFQTVNALELPKQGSNVYAEMNYKTSHQMTVAVAAYYPASATRRSTIINLNPSENWNKIYLNLTEAVSRELGAVNYRLYFFAFKPSGSGELNLLIDNLKIIY